MTWTSFVEHQGLPDLNRYTILYRTEVPNPGRRLGPLRLRKPHTQTVYGACQVSRNGTGWNVDTIACNSPKQLGRQTLGYMANGQSSVDMAGIVFNGWNNGGSSSPVVDILLPPGAKELNEREVGMFYRGFS